MQSKEKATRAGRTIISKQLTQQMSLFSFCELPIGPHWMIPKPTIVFLMTAACLWHEHFSEHIILTASHPINICTDKNEHEVSQEVNEKELSVQMTQLQPVSNQISTTTYLLCLLPTEY